MIRIAATFKSCRTNVSVRALSNSQEVLVLATGAGKQNAIKAWQTGESLPIAEIGKPAHVNVLLDKAAQS